VSADDAADDGRAIEDEQVPDYLRRAMSGIRWAVRDGLLTNDEARTLAHRVMAVADECWAGPPQLKPVDRDDEQAVG
jgi:hypothetical protein